MTRVLVALVAGLLPALGAMGPAGARGNAKEPPVTRAVEVPFKHEYPKGAIVIVNKERALYLVLGDGKARRYRVAVGEEFEVWTGRTFVSAKKEDPWWYPVDGSDPVPGGDPSNPLGRRAMYLDWSLLRIHGTPSRHSIGRAVSNGCIRMLDEDVKDLYERVHLGAPVIAINSMADAGKFAEAKFTGKIQEHVVVNDDNGWSQGGGRRAGRGAWPWDDDGWSSGRRRRSSRSRGYAESW
ncbi:MAG: L,D-transpeptidase [Hyphomicrobiaceae bacterium]